jgi:hypothetical protein
MGSNRRKGLNYFAQRIFNTLWFMEIQCCTSVTRSGYVVESITKDACRVRYQHGWEEDPEKNTVRDQLLAAYYTVLTNQGYPVEYQTEGGNVFLVVGRPVQGPVA